MSFKGKGKARKSKGNARKTKEKQGKRKGKQGKSKEIKGKSEVKARGTKEKQAKSKENKGKSKVKARKTKEKARESKLTVDANLTECRNGTHLKFEKFFKRFFNLLHGLGHEILQIKFIKEFSSPGHDCLTPHPFVQRTSILQG